jgi:hypothetical protein
MGEWRTEPRGCPDVAPLDEVTARQLGLTVLGQPEKWDFAVPVPSEKDLRPRAFRR